MVFIGVNELLGFLGDQGIINFSSTLSLYLYPARIAVVALLLAFFRKRYDEIRIRDLLRFRDTILSVIVGIVVFVLWINMPWTVGAVGAPAGYDPTVVSENFTRISLVSIRLVGASVVVPIMEELFWRSFVLRYLIDPDFSKISLGKFTWGAFLISAILFGFEHHFIVAGIMAGTAYNLLIYRTKSLTHCILAHGVTNVILGIYVQQTNQWQFW